LPKTNKRTTLVPENASFGDIIMEKYVSFCEICTANDVVHEYIERIVLLCSEE
jgi:hypothetical protein